MLLIPSIFGYSIESIYPKLCELSECGCNTIHIDVFDGSISEITFDGFDYIRRMASFLDEHDVRLNVHLVSCNPTSYLNTILKLGIDEISIDLCFTFDESFQYFIDNLKENFIKVGVIYNSSYPLKSQHVEKFDYIHVCATDYATNRPLTLEEIVCIVSDIKKFKKPIMVDGGVSLKNIDKYCAAGASLFVSGKGIFEGNALENYQKMLTVIGK